jgi:phosphotriesterase-related protein
MVANTKVRTVLGDINPQELGVTHSHEHLLIDLWKIVGTYDSIVEEEELITEELRRFGVAGGGAVIDCTNIGLGRNPEAVQRISKATSVHVVLGSGWYRERVYPDYIREQSADCLAERIVADIERGADGTGVRSGIIGEIGTERYFITPAEERVFRAAARAHHKTGAPIITHTTHFGDLALEQIALLKEEKVEPERICISHVGERHGCKDLIPIAATGVYLSVDHVGYKEFGSDQVQADNVAEMVRRGFVNQIMLAQDVCRMSMLHVSGGPGFDFLLRRFVPMMQERGVSETAIQTMLVANPARFLAF